MERTILYHCTQIATPLGSSLSKGKDMNVISLLEDGCIYCEDGIIKQIGKTDQVFASLGISLENPTDWDKQAVFINAQGSSVIPGFVDSHTHFIFQGYREKEFMMRLNGTSYLDIMRAGGGIQSSVNATREATFEMLYKEGENRLYDALSQGVTTMEGKSGYGLDEETEIRQLKVMQKLNQTHPVDLAITYLGAHAIPKEMNQQSEEYLNFIINTMLPYIKENNLAEFCDVFCEEEAFTKEQSKKLLQQAKELGYQLKIHADEINDLEGASLASELEAVSADHLLRISDKGIQDLAVTNVAATILPCTAFSLNKPYAPARKIIDAGCGVALATDFNPGSCFTNSIPLLLSLSVITMGLTMEEALCAITLNGAAAIGRVKEIGSVEVGKKADLLLLQYPDYRFLVYHTGKNIVKSVIKAGKVVI